MEHLEKGALLRKTPAELIAWVNAATLAEISLYRTYELEEIGWYSNPTVDRLYKLGSTGIWVPKETLATGAIPTENTMPLLSLMPMHPASVGAIDMSQPSYAPSLYLHRRIGVLDVTSDGAGAFADQELVPALAGYKGRIEIIGILPASTDAATALTFEDGDATGLSGGLPNIAMNFTASTLNTQLKGLILYSMTANKNLRVDGSGYAAAAHLIFIYYYFYEL